MVSYTFQKQGTYNVQCLNYPKLRLTVTVSEKDEDLTETYVETQSFNESMNNFLSEENSVLSFSNVERDFDVVGHCLQLLNSGKSAKEIKDQYSQVFAENREPEKEKRRGPKRESNSSEEKRPKND